jgi:two-component system chemotaxis response regulator CheB
MICDDSVVVRGAIARMLAAAPDIEVVAKVANGRAALDGLRQHDVDVVMLDIEMPVMDGLTALPLLLTAAPGISVIMVSSRTTRGADVSMQALRLGAADYLLKPSAEMAEDQRFRSSLIATVRGLGRMRRPQTAPRSAFVLRPAPRLLPKLLAIGSSTGGPNALFALVQQLSPSLQPCTEAKEGEAILPGRIVLAPGDRHLTVRRKGPGLVVHLADTPPENYCRPSVDPMLRSACEAVDGRVLVAMLTGMGRDGLLGSQQVIAAGGALVAQDEASSVVWGMPGAVTEPPA